MTYRPSRSLIRDYYLIRNPFTGDYIQGAVAGNLQWTTNPENALRFMLDETARQQIKTLAAVYGVTNLQIMSLRFKAIPTNPTHWILATDE